VGIAEAVGVDLAERFGIAVGSELVRHRNRVVAEALHAACHFGTARIETQDRGHDRVEALRLAGGARIRSAAVAESVIAAAGVEQSVIRITRLRRRIEFHRAHRVRQILNDVRFSKKLASRPLEHIRRRVGRMPLSDDVVVGDVLQRKAGRDVVRVFGLPAARSACTV
jgi:hypothetical protein